MRIAVTAHSPTAESAVDARFGRAYWILIYDEGTDSWEAVDNSVARNAVQGAGIRAAQTLAERKVNVLLTGVTGPKAFRALEAAGIQVYHGARGTPAASLPAWREGRLELATAETASGTP
jgi:predicted Fe-Mo cluster-binding NifX family protein